MNIEKLPETYEEFKNLAIKHYEDCEHCKKPFNNESVFTSLGWRETQISGYCEKCYDDACEDDL